MRDDILTEFTADVRGFRKGANYVDRRMVDLQRGVNGRLDRIDARWQRSTRAIDGFRGAVSSIAITAGLLKFGRDAFSVAKDFEAAMNRIKAATDAPATQIEALKARAMELGRTTVFSAGQVGDAAELLQKNGLDLAQILDGALDASVTLAAATGGSLSGAADLATDVMLQFGIGAGELPSIVDGLTAAMIKSKFGFDDLRLAIGQSGGVAASSGVEFEDLLTTIAAVAAAGTGGSDIGTAFKNMVVKFVGVGEKAKKEIRDLGLEFYDAEGSLRPMVEVVGELERVFAGMSEQARTSSLQIIFGTDAYKLASSLALSGAESFQKLADSMSQVSAADQAEARMLGAAGAAAKLAAAWEGVLLAFGDNGGLTAQTAALNSLASALSFISENIGTIGVAALTVAGSRGIGALVGALKRSNLAAREAVAQGAKQVSAAKHRVQIAKVELGQSKAKEAALGREAAGARRNSKAARNHTRAIKQLHLAQSNLTVATVAAARAGNAQAMAIKRSSVAARLAASSMGVLRGAMAFFGGPIGLLITAIGIGISALVGSSKSAAEKFDKLTQSTGELSGALGDMNDVAARYAGLITATADSQDEASGRIIANTLAEFNAKKSLLELELKRARMLQAERTGLIRENQVGLRDARAGFDISNYPDYQQESMQAAFDGTTAHFGDAIQKLMARRTLAGIEIGLGEAALALGFNAGGGAVGGNNGGNTPVITPPGGGGGGGGASGDGYTKWLAEINKRIEAQGAEAEAIGLTAIEADKLRAAREFLTMAERAGLELTPALRAEVGQLAEAYARAAQEARETTAAQTESADAAAAMSAEWSGYAKQLLANLRSGKTALESFLGLWENFITKLADKTIDSAFGAIFDSGGGGGGGGGGGFLGDLFSKLIGGIGGGGGAPVPHAAGGVFDGGSVPINKVVSGSRLFGMGGGGIGVMGERAPEAVMPLVRGPNGDLSVRAIGGGAAGVSVHNSFEVVVRTSDPQTQVEIRPSSRQSQRAARGMMGG